MPRALSWLVPLLLALPGMALAESSLSLDDDRMVAGQTVVIPATPLDTILALGDQVRVEGHTREDALVAGREVTLAGAVDGNVYTAGARVTVDGTVNGKVFAAGRTVSLSPEAVVTGGLRLTGDEVILGGEVHGPVAVAARTVFVAGSMHGPMRLRADHVTFLPRARLEGPLTLTTPERPEIPAEVIPPARVQWSAPPLRKSEGPTLLPDRQQMGWRGLIAVGLGATLILLVARRSTVRLAVLGRRHPLGAFFYGLLALVILTLAPVLLLLTVIGLPLAFAGLLIIPPLLVLAGLLGCLVWGGVVMGLLGRDSGPMLFLSLMLALVAYALVQTYFPWFAVILGGVTLILGLGAWVLVLRSPPPERLSTGL